MLKELFDRQSAIQSELDKYAPTRGVFEEFLRGGQNEDGFFFWRISPGGGRSRYSWRRQATLDISDGRKVAVEASTDPTRWKFGYTAGNIPEALIDVRVSLPENSGVARDFELPPVWAILEQNSVFSPLDLRRLETDLEEIVPLVRACLPQE